MTSVSVTPANLFVNELNTYTIKMTLGNNLVSGSFIDVMFPADIDMDLTSSVCTLSIAGHSCSVVSLNNLTITLTGAISKATEIVVTVINTKNAN